MELIFLVGVRSRGMWLLWEELVLVQGSGYTGTCRAQIGLHHGNLHNLPGVTWSDLATLW